jgi:hypothetical protein
VKAGTWSYPQTSFDWSAWKSMNDLIGCMLSCGLVVAEKWGRLRSTSDPCRALGSIPAHMVDYSILHSTSFKRLWTGLLWGRSSASLSLRNLLLICLELHTVVTSLQSFNPERTFRPKTGRLPFLTFQISLLYESVHHETFFGGR